MTWRAIIVVLILLGIAVGVIVGFFMIGDKTQFRPEIRQVLGDIGEGRGDNVWRDASYLFRRTLNQDAFEDMTARMNETLGKFVRITDVVEVTRSKSLGGRVGEVDVELEFENAITTGGFVFHKAKDGAWQMVSISVVIPEPLRSKADALEREFERIRAPDEVLASVSQILEMIRDDRAREVWEAASKPFRSSISAARFLELNRDYEKRLGKFVRVLTVISSGLHPAKDRAKVNVLLEYEKVRTNGLFSFVKAEDTWRLSFFKPLIPEPVIPGRAPGKTAGIPGLAPVDLGTIELDAGAAE